MVKITHNDLESIFDSSEQIKVTFLKIKEMYH